MENANGIGDWGIVIFLVLFAVLLPILGKQVQKDARKARHEFRMKHHNLEEREFE